MTTEVRDDRVLVATKVLAAIIVPFLVAAFALYVLPARTGWFAWTIKPTMTPMIMGAGYISGAYFFTRVFFATRWHRVHLGFLPITAFTLFEAIATVTHLEPFDTGRVAFWVWTILYVVTPILVPLTWLRNRRHDPRTLEHDDLYVPKRLRTALAVAAALQLAVAFVLLASPQTMIDVWPWQLTPLTAGVLGGWFALPGMVALMMAIDGRWSAIRITLDSQIIGLALIAVAITRAWDEFDTSNLVTYLFVGGIALLLVGVVTLRVTMERLRQAKSTNALPRVAPETT